MATILSQGNLSHHIIMLSSHQQHVMNITRMATILSQKKTHHIIYTTSTKESKFAMLNLESKAHNKNDYYPKPETHQNIMTLAHRKDAQKTQHRTSRNHHSRHTLFIYRKVRYLWNSSFKSIHF